MVTQSSPTQKSYNGIIGRMAYTMLDGQWGRLEELFHIAVWFIASGVAAFAGMFLISMLTGIVNDGNVKAIFAVIFFVLVCIGIYMMYQADKLTKDPAFVKFFQSKILKKKTTKKPRR